MAEIRLRIAGEDELSSEINKVSESLNKCEKEIKETEKASEGLDAQLKKQKENIIATKSSIDRLVWDVQSLAYSLNDLGIVSDQQMELFQKFDTAIQLVSGSIDALTSAQELYTTMSKMMGVTTTATTAGMTGMTVSTQGAASAMALLAAKIALVVGAGLALGIGIATLVLGLYRMIKMGESVGEAFGKSFDFAIGSIKKFTSAIGDAVTALSGVEEAEKSTAMTIPEVRKALEEQREVVRGKNQDLTNFIITCRVAGATEKQLAQAAEEGRISFEKQATAEEKLRKRVEEITYALQNQRDVTMDKNESLEEFVEYAEKAGATEEQLAQAMAEGAITFEKEKEAVKEDSKAIESWISTMDKAIIAEKAFGVTVDEAALKIAKQEKFARGKNQSMDAYRKTLQAVGLSEQEITNIIEKGIWPWEKEAEAVDEATEAMQGAVGIFGAVKKEMTEEESPDWLKRVLEYIEKRTEEEQKSVDLQEKQLETLKESVGVLDQMLAKYKTLNSFLKETESKGRSIISDSQRKAYEMYWQVVG
jgi:hypothetical protein